MSYRKSLPAYADCGSDKFAKSPQNVLLGFPHRYYQQDSLTSMRILDAEAMNMIQGEISEHPKCLSSAEKMARVTPAAFPAFFCIDEYKDLSLREILELSDDVVFDIESVEGTSSEEDPLTPDVSGDSVRFEASAFPGSACPPTAISSSAAAVHAVASAVNLEHLTSKFPDIAKLSKVSGDKSKIRRRELESTCNDGDGEDDTFGLSDEFDMDESDSGLDSFSDSDRFRSYQKGQWSIKYEELCDYRRRFGNCLVHYTFKENLPLARWVKRQRYQYKLMMEGKSSTMTEERVKALDTIGFIWDSQGAAWYEHLSELSEFKQDNGHCNVPSNFVKNTRLATWVKCQRRQYKLFREGKLSNMTQNRIAELDEMGFEWELRTSKKPRTSP